MSGQVDQQHVEPVVGRSAAAIGRIWSRSAPTSCSRMQHPEEGLLQFPLADHFRLPKGSTIERGLAHVETGMTWSGSHERAGVLLAR
jgi:hypothetical protein